MRAYISSLSFKAVALLQLTGTAYEKRVPTAPSIALLGFQGFVAPDADYRGESIHEEQHYEPKSWISYLS
jgi:hypothetical protein